MIPGLLDVCKELEITPIAYEPLAQGLLTGKYHEHQVCLLHVGIAIACISYAYALSTLTVGTSLSGYARQYWLFVSSRASTAYLYLPSTYISLGQY